MYRQELFKIFFIAKKLACTQILASRYLSWLTITVKNLHKKGGAKMVLPYDHSEIDFGSSNKYAPSLAPFLLIDL